MNKHSLYYNTALCTMSKEYIHAKFAEFGLSDSWNWKQWAMNCAPILEYGNTSLFVFALRDYVYPSITDDDRSEPLILIFTNFEVLKSFEEYYNMYASTFPTDMDSPGVLYYNDRVEFTKEYIVQLTHKTYKASPEEIYKMGNRMLRAAILVGNIIRIRELIAEFASLGAPLNALFVVRDKALLHSLVEASIYAVHDAVRFEEHVKKGKHHGESSQVAFKFPQTLAAMFPCDNFHPYDLQMILKTYSRLAEDDTRYAPYFNEMIASITKLVLNEIKDSGPYAIKFGEALLSSIH